MDAKIAHYSMIAIHTPSLSDIVTKVSNGEPIDFHLTQKIHSIKIKICLDKHRVYYHRKCKFDSF